MEQLLKSKYRIGKKLSETPFSITYQGFFIGTEKPVLVKIYKRGTLSSSLIKSMKQRVIEFSLLNHHGIAKMLDGDYGWQGFYYVREYIDGQSLPEILKREGKFSVEKIEEIADQLLETLEIVHSKGILHADIKPTNIFIDSRGIVKLTDFLIEGEIKEVLPQKAEEISLNAKYQSPEAVAGESLSPASDIYSLAMVLYEMAAGSFSVFEDGLGGNIKKLKFPNIFPKGALPAMPQYFKDLLCKCMQKDRLLRLKSAARMRECLAKKSLILTPAGSDEYARIYESVVTQYGGEEISPQLMEELEEVGRVKIGWKKEKHRNYLLAIFIAAAVILGFVYSFFAGR